MTRGALATSLFLFLVGLVCDPSWAYRDAFTPEQKAQLAKIQTVLLEVVALTDAGKAEAGPLTEVVTRRMEELNYTVVTAPSQPHDVVLKVKCEQRKTWEGTTTMGSDADLPDSPSRVWKGPACQINYLLQGVKIKWQKEVRTDFEDAVEAAKAANAGDPGQFAMNKLQGLLEKYDFPVLLAGEWGHSERLLQVLDAPETREHRKLKVIAILGEMLADNAMPMLKQVLKDKDLAKQAAVAMGNIGKESIPVLIDILKNSKDSELQAAAAKGLGQVGALHGDPRIVPPLLEMLDAPGIDMAVQTEIAWALGKLPDRRSLKPLRDLDHKLLKIRDPGNKEFQTLKEAVMWSIKQCDMDGHIS